MRRKIFSMCTKKYNTEDCLQQAQACRNSDNELNAPQDFFNVYQRVQRIKLPTTGTGL
ncbi:MAG: hypothetical protein Q4D80_03360 [Pseudomonadota bacterium]|nr:hypothetical protein [Pseudomonadota bacterium]